MEAIPTSTSLAADIVLAVVCCDEVLPTELREEERDILCKDTVGVEL